MKNILVLCTGNSCRSQMAHGYLNHFTNGKANIFSAGIETHGVNPKAIAIMNEDGIDISDASESLERYEQELVSLQEDKKVSTKKWEESASKVAKQNS